MNYHDPVYSETDAPPAPLAPPAPPVGYHDPVYTDAAQSGLSDDAKRMILGAALGLLLWLS